MPKIDTRSTCERAPDHISGTACRLRLSSGAEFGARRCRIEIVRDKRIDWHEYAAVDPGGLDNACFLCSGRSPDACHRQLAAGYFRRAFAGRVDVQIVHL
jgi:hypothetical protein